MNQIIGPRKGIMRGETIELKEPVRIPDGSEVMVSIQVMPTVSSSLQMPEGLRKAFGGWRNDQDDLDAFMKWNREQRKQNRRELQA